MFSRKMGYWKLMHAISDKLINVSFPGHSFKFKNAPVTCYDVTKEFWRRARMINFHLAHDGKLNFTSLTDRAVWVFWEMRKEMRSIQRLNFS